MNMVLFEHCKEIENGSLFKSKNETKEKVLNKSKSLVKILLTRFIPLMFTKCLSKPLILDGKKIYLRMNACMHEYAKERRKHDVV
jgi:hypothetical protein